MRRIFITNGYVCASTVELTARVLFSNDVFYKETDVELHDGSCFTVHYVVEGDGYTMNLGTASRVIERFVQVYEDEIDNAEYHAIEDNETQFRLLFDKFVDDFTLSGFVISI